MKNTVAIASLLRAVNLLGHGRVSMKDLRQLYESCGFQDVTTCLQSGNVVFRTVPIPPTELAATIEAACLEKLGVTTRVMLRTPDQWAEILRSTHFLQEREQRPSHVLVFFLSAQPEPSAFEALRESYKGPEKFHLSGTELFVDYCEGIARSKLTSNLLEKKLGVAGTARNWNTVKKVHQLLEGLRTAP